MIPGFLQLEVGSVKLPRPFLYPGLQLPGRLPQFLIEPRILDCDDCLARQSGQELDLSFIANLRDIRERHEKTPNLLPIQQWNNDHRPYPHPTGGSPPGSKRGIFEHIFNGNWGLVSEGLRGWPLTQGRGRIQGNAEVLRKALVIPGQGLHA